VKFTKRLWGEDDRKILAEKFANTYTDELCEILNRSYSSIACQARLMGLSKSAEFRKIELQKQAERLRIEGAKSRFVKGNEPFNKGKKMPDSTYVKCSVSMFKKGRIPHNAIQDMGEVIRKDKSGKDYVMIKVPGERRIKFKHVWLWESNNGKVPEGYNVVFKDGNTFNCSIENLECISDKELMIRNTIHRFPPELVSTIRLTNKLKRKINATQQN